MQKQPIETTYTLTEKGKMVIRDVDQAWIPNNPDNVDWQEYQAWLALGNTPNPVPATEGEAK
jgi:hypothetical protein